MSTNIINLIIAKNQIKPSSIKIINELDEYQSTAESTTTTIDHLQFINVIQLNYYMTPD